MVNKYSQYLPDNPELSFNARGIKFQSSVSSPFNSSDIYQDESVALARAESIGCSGTRKVLVSSIGQYNYSPCTDVSTYRSIMKQLNQTQEERKYYQAFQDENLYDIANSINDTAYSGFDYKDVIFERTMSKVIFRDPTKTSIIQTMNRVVFGMIESVKQIKNYFNYTVPSNNKRVL
jgi:hypothetical protein